ncbi:hypothetical protein FOCC_FOCC012329 [Frankliniella occidentalis]|nr:hypothetical protein FOCC_FOCC012329 [Frankliniella occidentalis]
MWTENYSKKFHYIGFTIQFANDDWEMEAYILGVKKFAFKCATAENIKFSIKNFFIEELKVLETEFRKIEFVTDKGQNMIKALSEFSRYDCMAHMLNTVLQTTFTLMFYELRSVVDDIEKSPHSRSVLNTVSTAVKAVKAMKLTANSTDVDLADLKKALDFAFPARHSYIKLLLSYLANKEEVHTVLRALEKGDVVDTLLAYADDIRSITIILKPIEENESLMDNFVIVNECKELVHYVRSAGGAHFGELRYTLQQECDTRWNTMYNLLMSVHRVYDELLVMLQEKGQAKKMDNIGKEDLQTMLEFLEPFKEETKKIQGKKYPTLPLALLSITRLTDHCDSNFEDSHTLSMLRARCLRLLKEKIEVKMRYKVALFLWPPYKELAMLHPDEISEVHEMVRSMLRSYEVHRMDTVANEPAGEGEPDDPAPLPPPSLPKQRQLEKGYERYRMKSVQLPVHADEVDKYVEMAPLNVKLEDLLKWWQSMSGPDELPKLALLARRELPKNLTSAHSETVFSDCGWIKNERKSNMSPETLDAVVFLHDYNKQNEKKES